MPISDSLPLALRSLISQAKPADLIACKACEDLLRQQLTPSLVKLFAELTGLRFHVTWLEPSERYKSGALLILCPTARERRGPGELPAACRACLARNWTATGRSICEGRRFVGTCAASNFCISLRLGTSAPSVLLVLQARINGNGPVSRENPGLALRPVGCRQGRKRLIPSRNGSKSGVAEAAFRRAVALARLIRQELEATVQAWTTQKEVGHLQSQVQNLQQENTVLRRAARERSPEKPAASTVQASGNHTQKIVREMMAYVQQHYHRPMSLGEVAAALKMNAAYLSSLFSTTAGVTFHKYLEEVRFTKARELLRNPHNRVCEVACAVGYASADQFRHAFKASTGVPPSSVR